MLLGRQTKSALLAAVAALGFDGASGTLRAQGIASTQDVVWQQMTSHMAVSYPQTPGSGSTLIKWSGAAGWNVDDAASVQVLRGDGCVTFTVSSTLGVTVGLTPRNLDHAWASIAYGLQCKPDGTLWLVENGTSSQLGSYATGDTYKIERVGTTVKYWKIGNASPIVTRAGVSIGSLIVDTNFNGASATITACKIQDYGSDEQDVLWDELVLLSPDYTTPDEGSALTHSSTAGWQGAISSKRIRGDGYLKFRFGQVTKNSAIGLSFVDGGSSNNSVQYGFEAVAGTTGQVRVLTPASRNATTFSYVASDTFTVKRVGTQIFFYKNDAQIGLPEPVSTSPLLVDAKLNSANASVQACRYAGVSGAQKVIWTSTLLSATTYSSALSKVQKTGASNNTWDANAVGAKAISRAGAFSFRFDQINKLQAAGFYIEGATPVTIAAGLQASTNGTVQAIESGQLQGSPVTFTTSDVFTVRRAAGQISYEKNGVSFYSHSMTTAFETARLLAAAQFADSGASISGCEYTGVAEDIQWREPSGTGVTLDTPVRGGTRLNRTRTSTTPDWNSDAVSTVQIPGDGYVEFRPTTASKAIAVGLVAANADNAYASFPFCIRTSENSTFFVVEGGTSITTAASWAVGDVFRIERRNGGIYYYRNGALLNTTWTPQSTGTLFVDTSLYSIGNGYAINDARVYAAPTDSDADGIPDTWEYQYFAGKLDAASQSGGPGFENDFDHDGVTNLQEYLNGTDPTDYFDGHAPDIRKDSTSDNQFSDPGTFAPQRLTIRLYKGALAGDPPVNGGPVTFTVTAGAGKITLDKNNLVTYPLSSQITFETLPPDGIAQVDFQQPNTNGTSSTVQVTAGSGASAATPRSFSLNTTLMIGRWKFDEVSGTTAVDSSPSSPSNSGTLQGATARVASFDTSGFPNDGYDGALSFDGSGAKYVSVVNNTSLQFSAMTFSVVAWVRTPAGTALSGSSDVYPVVSKWSGAGGGFDFSLRGDKNGLSFRIMQGGSPAPLAGSTPPDVQEITPSANLSAVLSDGRPHLIAFTRETSGLGRLYVDGAQIASKAGMAGSLGSTSALWFGKNNAAQSFKGMMDDVRLLATPYRPDEIQAIYNTYDSDNDGLGDAWERTYFGNLSKSASGDDDASGPDGLTNIQEFQRGTNPVVADSDSDGLPDGQEVQLETDPLKADTDSDGIPDGYEVLNNLNPKTNDAAGDKDGDGLSNLAEYQAGTRADNPDTDGDGMSDSWELQNGMNPTQFNDPNVDSDGDGMTDAQEAAYGRNPHGAATATTVLKLKVFTPFE